MFYAQSTVIQGNKADGCHLFPIVFVLTFILSLYLFVVVVVVVIVVVIVFLVLVLELLYASQFTLTSPEHVAY